MDLQILLLLSLDKDIHGKPKKLNSKQLDTIRKLGYVKVLTKLGCYLLVIVWFLACASILVQQFIFCIYLII